MAEKDDGQSKLFVVLVVSLVGLLVLGLLGIGGVFVLRKNMEQQMVAARPTPTLVIKLPPVSPTPNQQVPTDTPAPTPTNTPVIQSGNKAEPVSASNLQTDGTPESEADEGATDGETTSADGDSPTPKPSPTATTIGASGSAEDGSNTASSLSVPEDAAKADTVPNTGLNAFQTILLTLGLVSVLIVARRLRTA